ncbi:hypothetical protein [Agrobacterium tumefaciens]|uniref:hypothetical protein n=1 Tax=Agrobacterium tumefaciens TaxID=358 RepID=UPI00045A5E53|nr:hypothetical protein [Agrobacterium tumefaciens]CDN92508.1 hypothetical protein BN949_01653 [Agrobacterium tumefaciens]
MTRNREILMDVCTALGIGGPDDPRNVKVDGAEISAATALGKLWNDDSYLPTTLRAWVSDYVDRRPETISTYAMAARLLMPIVKQNGPAAAATAPDHGSIP